MENHFKNRFEDRLRNETTVRQNGLFRLKVEFSGAKTGNRLRDDFEGFKMALQGIVKQK